MKIFFFYWPTNVIELILSTRISVMGRLFGGIMKQVPEKTKRAILKDRKLGMMIGQLSWKYNLTIKQVDKICNQEEQ